jgi:hypothetical protein
MMAPVANPSPAPRQPPPCQPPPRHAAAAGDAIMSVAANVATAAIADLRYCISVLRNLSMQPLNF